MHQLTKRSQRSRHRLGHGVGDVVVFDSLQEGRAALTRIGGAE